MANIGKVFIVCVWFVLKCFIYINVFKIYKDLRGKYYDQVYFIDIGGIER